MTECADHKRVHILEAKLMHKIFEISYYYSYYQITDPHHMEVMKEHTLEINLNVRDIFKRDSLTLATWQIIKEHMLVTKLMYEIVEINRNIILVKMLTETGPHGDHKRTHTRDKPFPY